MNKDCRTGESVRDRLRRQQEITITRAICVTVKVLISLAGHLRDWSARLASHQSEHMHCSKYTVRCKIVSMCAEARFFKDCLVNVHHCY